MSTSSFLPRLFVMALLFPGAWACGGAGGGSLSDTAGRVIEGQYAWRPVPSSEQVASFSALELSFVAYEALAGGNALATMGPAQPLNTAALSCAVAGCSFQQADVDLTTATKGAFGLIALTSNLSQQTFVPTATMVISPNQIANNKATRTELTAQGQAVLYSQAGLNQIAKLVGTTRDELLARGVCIGTVTSSRTYGPGTPPGQANAYVSLVDAPAGASVFYVNDSWLATVQNGTNAAGTFVVVGPTSNKADGSATTIAVTVAASGTNLRWPDQAVILRPQMVVAVPILPYP